MSDSISESTPTKQCTKCQQFFPATFDFFYTQKSGKYGFRSTCKRCASRSNTIGLLPPDGTLKQCTGPCLRTLPATPEFFPRRQASVDGLQQLCKLCTSEYKKQHYQKNKEQVRAKHKAYREANRDAISEMHKQYYQNNKERLKARNKVNREKSIERERRRSREYRQNNKERVLAYQREYYRGNKERIRAYYLSHFAARRQGKIAYLREYRKKNLEALRLKERESARKNKESRRSYLKSYARSPHGRLVYRAAQHRRRVRMQAIQGTLTTEQIKQKLKAQRYRCYYAACGYAKFEKKKGKYIFHLEHTVPISRTEHNPRHDMNYVVLSCPTCNLSKHARLPHEFPEGGRLF